MSIPEESPERKAQKLSAPPRLRRFYERVEMPAEAGGFMLRLDGRRAMTPGRNPLLVSSRRMADAIAAEWARQGEFIDASAMPVTRLANSAIDGVAAHPEDVRAGIRGYAGTDLLCYRAGEPEVLVARQRQAWDPVVAWAEQRYGRLRLAEGVVHVAQPDSTLAALGAELDAFGDAFMLAGLHVATTLTGSALLALALAHRRLDEDAAWTAAHVDEDWNISQWGADFEAERRRAARRRDFDAAALALVPESDALSG